MPSQDPKSSAQVTSGGEPALPLRTIDGASIPIQDAQSDMDRPRAENCPATLLSLHGIRTNLILESVLALRDHTMHSSTQHSARSLRSSISGWCSDSFLSLEQRTRRVLTNARIKHRLSQKSVRKALPLIGMIAGAAACALWLNSIAAGAFAFIVLFLLSNIGRSLQHIAGLLRAQSAAALHPAWRAPSVEGPNQPNIYISTKAMERLRPWVDDESALTEESAKAYCSVLLDTLAMLRPTMAGRARVEDS